ncbi:MAG: nucleotidyltransferase family protein [Proteobacteria bacterium]|nr:nucleotidyltransferase family protein [Pseudomonadota bacterium]
MMPKRAMLLAAGLGQRMRPVTDVMPKPMVKVGGKSLIDWTLDALDDAGVPEAVVNVHYLAPLLVKHLAGRARPRVVISDETAQLLDTGGGVTKALPLLGADPFFVCNCDAIVAGGTPAAARLAGAWTDALDVLMLVHPRASAHGFDGPGDFFVDAQGRMTRRGTAAEAPYVYAGLFIVHPRAFASAKVEPFSLNKIWNTAIAADRMRAVVHDGRWYHVGTPEAIGETETLLAREHSE